MLETFSEFDTSFSIFGFKTLQKKKRSGKSRMADHFIALWHE